MNYRKRIRVFPGITLNLSKQGISTTIGVKGLSVNFSERGTYLNTGIPGTGLYNRTRLDGRKGFQNTEELDSNEYEIIQNDNQDLTSKEMSGLKEQLVDTWVERKKIEENISDEKVGFGFCVVLFLAAAFGSYHFIKEYLDYSSTPNLIYMICAASLAAIFLLLSITLKRKINKNKERALHTVLNIDLQVDDENAKDFNNLLNCYEDLKTSERIYHISNLQAINSIQQRTAAAYNIERHIVNIFDSSFNNFIITPFEPVILSTSDNRKLFLYPGFIIILNEKSFYLADAIQLISWKDIHIEGITSPFLEEEGVPADAQVVGQSWKYVNKNGSPDRRYSNNYQIPIVQYYEFVIALQNNVNFCFQVSDVNKGSCFCESLKKLKYNIDNIGKVEEKTKSTTTEDISSKQEPVITINERIATRIKEFFVIADSKLNEIKSNIRNNEEWERQYADYAGVYGLTTNDISLIDLMKYDLIATSILCRYGSLQENLKKGNNVFSLISLYFPTLNTQIIAKNINKFIHDNKTSLVPNSLDLISTMVVSAQKENPKEDWLLVTGYSSIVFDYIDIIELFYHIVFAFGEIQPYAEEKNNLKSFSNQIRELAKNSLVKSVNENM